MLIHDAAGPESLQECCSPGGCETGDAKVTRGYALPAKRWQHIRDGALPVHHIKGKILRVYMGSMNDWPEFAMLSDTGEESEWSHYANEPEFDAFYTVGRPTEINYVIQRTRGMPADFQKIPLEIRVDDKYA